MTRSHSRHDQGFSLLEMLVALAIFAGLTLLTLQGVQYVSQAQDRVVRAEHNIRQILALHQRARFWLMTMFPFDSNLQGKGPVYPLVARGESVRFVAPVARGGAPKRIELLHDRASHTLVAEICPDLLGSIDPADCIRDLLVAEVKSVDFQFLDRFRGQERWLSRWERRHDLPMAVRLTLKRDPDALPLPTLTIVPRLEQQAHCDLDPVSRECR